MSRDFASVYLQNVCATNLTIITSLNIAPERKRPRTSASDLQLAGYNFLYV